ncbi:unnamed protein product, partial [Rotaria sp. Silwood2]
VYTCIYESPIIIAPTAFHRLAHIDGEVATARGATEAKCIYTYNWVYSTMPEEKVLQTTGNIQALSYLTFILFMILGPKFFHIYLTAPIDILEKIVPQVDKKGYRAIVVTCDDPTTRVRDHILPLFLEASEYIDPTIFQTVETANINMNDLCSEPTLTKMAITWTNLERLRKLTRLPIICKGILSPVDAEIAIKYGANGIIVSNHGSRLIDTTVPAIECLKDIINVVDGRAEGKVCLMKISNMFLALKDLR